MVGLGRQSFNRYKLPSKQPLESTMQLVFHTTIGCKMGVVGVVASGHNIQVQKLHLGPFPINFRAS